jgi:hypothetical protein
METKICNKCGRIKPLDAYYKAARNRGGRYHTCKKCKQEIDAKYYHSSDKKKLKIKERQVENQRRVEDYKRLKGCLSCSECEPIALDFHHRDANSKEFTISHSSKRFSWERILREIEKCDVLCSNCHRKLHAGVLVLECAG